MQRSVFIKAHLYVAAFLVPFVLVMTLTGVLELLGIEGKTLKEVIYSADKDILNFNSPSIKSDVRKLLLKLDENPDIDRVKIKKDVLYTLPNYTTHYAFKIVNGYLKAYRQTPNIQQKLMSLHKGNGPAVYKIYQKIFAYGLLFVLLSGLWLGLTSSALRYKTLVFFFSGIIFYLLLINY